MAIVTLQRAELLLLLDADDDESGLIESTVQWMILSESDILAAAWMKSSALNSSTGFKSPEASLMREPLLKASIKGICSTGQGTLLLPLSLDEFEEDESFLVDDCFLPPLLLLLLRFSLEFPLEKVNLTWWTCGDFGVDGPLPDFLRLGESGYGESWADCPADEERYILLLLMSVLFKNELFGTPNDELWLLLLDGFKFIELW